jgi:hypothetical protein
LRPLWDEDAFIRVAAFQALRVRAGMLFDVALPPDTFVHRRPGEPLRIQLWSVEQAPLPSWLHFLPGPGAGGRLLGMWPTGLRRLALSLSATDSQGRQAQTPIVFDGEAGLTRADEARRP